MFYTLFCYWTVWKDDRSGTNLYSKYSLMWEIVYLLWLLRLLLLLLLLIRITNWDVIKAKRIIIALLLLLGLWYAIYEKLVLVVHVVLIFLLNVIELKNINLFVDEWRSLLYWLWWATQQIINVKTSSSIFTLSSCSIVGRGIGWLLLGWRVCPSEVKVELVCVIIILLVHWCSITDWYSCAHVLPNWFAIVRGKLIENRT